MTWKNYFNKKILERGYQYFLEDRITEFVYEDDIYFANVLGNEEYCVQIEPLPNGEYEMFCNCPHAQDGYNCKHMAAVLYYIESLNQNHSDQKDIIINQINDCDSNELIQFLSELLVEDYGLYQKFKKKFNLFTKEELQNNIKQELKNINCKSSYYYYDEDGIYHFYIELISYMTKHFPVLLNQEEYSFLFELILEAIIKFAAIFVYEKVNGYERVLNCLFDYIDQLVLKADDTFKEYIFNQLFELTQGNKLLHYKKDFIDYLYMRFDDESYVEVKKEIAKDKINEYVHFNIDTCNYWLEKYLSLQPTLLDVQEVCLPHINNNNISNKYILYLFKHHFDKECISYLENQVLNKRVNKNEYIILKELYKRNNDKEQYLSCLLKLLSDYQGDLEIFIEYKNCFNEQEWILKREELFAQCMVNDNYGYFLVEEKLYEQLLNYIIIKNNFYYVQLFEDQLIEKYSKEILDLYEQEIDRILEPVSNRDTYYFAAIMIERMTKFIGGKEKAQALIDKYKTIYFRRSALKEELRKIRL